jgi:ABC-type antimicrobial peptide transport system permease subunit
VPALRAAVAEVDRDLPLADIQSMDERTANAVAPQYVAMRLATLFAAAALLLSMVGLYGVLVGLVNRRTREIGIRMALGDTIQGIFRLVLKEGALLIVAGLAAGLGAALLMARTLDGIVFGVRATDPVLFVAVALVTGATALLACVEPAIRAARIDPVRVLSKP